MENEQRIVKEEGDKVMKRKDGLAISEEWDEILEREERKGNYNVVYLFI